MWYMWGIGFLILSIFGFSGHRSHGKLSPIIMERLFLDEDQLDYFKQETRENFKEFRKFLNLIERALG